ncbi:hypothetical protein F7Q99_10715 [Streptomyces kaniharaensis]|uniref:OmpR/PhoB-type domain-containing protein n=1 Tax=Streptomyces kaniharaensis TaxID=212423 RepID=A0A6N7KQA2_9ACTN|nr:hypothetical protein [Streptomyces kaniharaensis]
MRTRIRGRRRRAVPVEPLRDQLVRVLDGAVQALRVDPQVGGQVALLHGVAEEVAEDAALAQDDRGAAFLPSSFGDHTVDLAATTVTGPAGPVRLTPTEWRILALLLANPGRLVPGRQILREVWGPAQEGRGNHLRVYLAGLRRKLERDPARPRHLITEPGIGYRYEP